MFEFDKPKHPVKDNHKVDFCFYIQLPSIGGYATHMVSKEQYEKFKKNPIDIVSDFFGVSVAVYWEWFDAQGYLRCIAINKNGKQCACSIPGRQLDCVEWVEKRKVGGYCKKHGGG